MPGLEAPVRIRTEKGFTINMFHTPVGGDFSWATEVSRDYVRVRDAKTRKFVESNYDTGYVFGAFVAVGVTNSFPRKGGMVVFFTGTNDVTELEDCLRREFLVRPKYYKRTDTVYTVNVHSAALARLMAKFGEKENRHVPNEYLVDNPEYLRGIREGLMHFNGHKEDTRDVLSPRHFNPRNVAMLKAIDEVLGIDGQG